MVIFFFVNKISYSEAKFVVVEAAGKKSNGPAAFYSGGPVTPVPAEDTIFYRQLLQDRLKKLGEN
jgi:hypothetical protein